MTIEQTIEEILRNPVANELMSIMNHVVDDTGLQLFIIQFLRDVPDFQVVFRRYEVGQLKAALSHQRWKVELK